MKRSAFIGIHWNKTNKYDYWYMMMLTTEISIQCASTHARISVSCGDSFMISIGLIYLVESNHCSTSIEMDRSLSCSLVHLFHLPFIPLFEEPYV